MEHLSTLKFLNGNNSSNANTSLILQLDAFTLKLKIIKKNFKFVKFCINIYKRFKTNEQSSYVIIH